MGEPRTPGGPIDTDAIRANLQMVGATSLPIYFRQSLLEMADEIDRLRGAIQLAIDLINDDDNQDEMSSDAQEWCAEITAILNKVFP